MLKGFVDFECNFYTFITQNQEQLQKMQLWALINPDILK
jgi:hypothetical protein